MGGSIQVHSVPNEGSTFSFDIKLHSDFDFEKTPSNVFFYDYTKIANRDNVPANYDLTFSYSGVPQYQEYVKKAVIKGMWIAVVFRTRAAIPESFLGLDCVDGDDSDIRHIDPAGVIVALYAKGKARRDNSGFVVDTPRRVISIQSEA
jgi:hypothetical protein